MSKGPFDYQAEALQTLSDEWHADGVDHNDFARAVLEFIRAAEKLDGFKKATFYGATEKLPASCRRPEEIAFRPLHVAEENRTLLHAIVGTATEAGELCEAALDVLAGGALDVTNVCEEFGDLEWYVAIGASTLNATIDKFHRANIAKLRSRYPDKFTAYDAQNRDLFAENETLKTMLSDMNGDIEG